MKPVWGWASWRVLTKLGGIRASGDRSTRWEGGGPAIVSAVESFTVKGHGELTREDQRSWGGLWWGVGKGRRACLFSR